MVDIRKIHGSVSATPRALLLLFLLSAPLFADRPRGVEPGLARAQAMLAAGDYRQAVTLYDHVISEFPASPEAHFQKAFALEKLGEPQRAIAEYETTLRLDPKDARALNNLGFLLVDKEVDVPRGERLLRKALELAPDFAAAHDSLGWAEYRRKNYGQAEMHFRAAMGKDPGNTSALYHAGVMGINRGDYARASLYLGRLVEKEPNHVKGLMGLGMALERLGKRDDARKTLARALKQVRRDSAVGRELVRMLNELGPYHAGASLERFLAAPSERAAALIGAGREPARVSTEILEGSGSRAPALDFRKRPTDEDSKPGPAPRGRPARLDGGLARRHLELARLYEEHELHQDAASELETVMNLEPGSAEAREARDRLTKLGGQREISQEARLAGYLKMGEALFSRQADEEAKLQYEKVLLTDGTHAVANKALAFLYLRNGDLKRATEHVDRALAREPRYLEALLIRGYIQARQRQFDRSRRSFEEAAALAPAESEVGRYAGDMAERMRRFSSLQ